MSDTFISESIKYIGADDTTLDLFESQYQVPNGVSYNSYVILDEKVAVMDTIDARKSDEWFANLSDALGERTIDYIVISHLEPDHAANIKAVADKYPAAKLVLSTKAKAMLPQFFTIDNLDERCITVADGQELSLGTHNLKFIMAPMVHWPEVMLEYETTEKVLFSADAFGKFGALSADEDWTCEARRYYFNIVGKYGAPVQTLLKKAAGLDIQLICSLHGPIWRENLSYIIDKYDKWSKYEPEDKEVVMIYGSVYGHTEQAVDALAGKLAEKGIRHIAVYDVSKTHVSELIAEIFRASHIVIACATYNGGIYPPMENLLNDMKALSVQKRTVALMDNGTWAPTAGKQIVKKLEEMKEMELLTQQLSIKSVLKNDREAELDAFAQQIIDAM